MIHTAAKFEPTATQLLDKIAHLCQSKDASWNLIQSEPCRFDSLPPPPAQGTYRIHGTIPVAAKTLFAAVWDTKNSIALSTSLDKDFTLVSFKEHAVPMEIVYHQHRSPSWGVTARDFVVLRTFRQVKDDEYVMASTSEGVEHMKELDDSFVRGHLHCSGYHLKQHPTQANACLFTYVIQTDPKGWIPGFVVANAQKQMPEFFKLIHNFVTK